MTDSKKDSQYARAAEGWSENQYADAALYLRRRAELVATLGVPLVPGDIVLDLACGDAGLGTVLLDLGFGYSGLDLTAEMVTEATARLRGRGHASVGDLNEFPGQPVAAITLFRALYYVRDRAAFFARAAAVAEKKLVFDLNPRQYPLGTITRELRSAGFSNVVMRPFFVPQRRALSWPAAQVASILERSGPAARLALRFRFTYVVAASITRDATTPSGRSSKLFGSTS